MKATIVLIGNSETENYGRKLMLEAQRIGNLGFQMARLPHHVSLKQPFVIPSLEEMEEFFDEFVKGKKIMNIEFEELSVCPSNAIGGKESGCVSIVTKEMPELYNVQRDLFVKLEKRFGPCPAPFDNEYIFHMTIAIGGAQLENYQKAYDALAQNDYKKVFTFDKLGLLYYDDDNIEEGTYFCYKIHNLL